MLVNNTRATKKHELISNRRKKIKSKQETYKNNDKKTMQSIRITKGHSMGIRERN